MYALRTAANVSRVAGVASARIVSAVSDTRTPYTGTTRLLIMPANHAMLTSMLAARRAYSSAHGDESYEEFNRRYTAAFESVPDLFELQRNLDNCFAYDLVPSAETITAALHACRRVNDFPTAVRIFDALKEKTNEQQYKEYMAILEPVKEQLGVPTSQELGL
ncbi:putative cytochrome c oxidase subunit VA [Syncephalis pseudoplumigaleata]|uniref:Cytochrome c oxidase subunit 6, mitochondrial n=1 Tax=Syncephalis pseudoplumigaleata TaxID=1712513 RepID=A0A4P9YU81_9FUNG|nr:putative cytochrome c oxidase subunit VA [Syncephalis pseudoplumigaleata]|eukprot:RKP22751.1 putative cytochrome c oxidase subunit VA [Syncephalis pseudoplumigaleata]